MLHNDNLDQAQTEQVEQTETQAEVNTAQADNLQQEQADKVIIDKQNQEITELKDKYVRLLAEFENYKRRTAKENFELRMTANKELMVSLLDVLDDCDRAEIQLHKTEDNLEKQKEGIQLVFNKVRNVLFSKGLKAMTSINEEFNVELHEAITEIPAPTDELKNKVIDEVQKGYYLNDKIIRFAKVVVGK